MSRSMTPITRCTPLSFAVRARCSVAQPGTSVAESKYLRKSSRPLNVREPTRAPKSSPASAVKSRTFARVAFGSKTTGALWMTAAANRLDIPGNREQYRWKHMKTLLVLLITLGVASAALAQATQGQEVTLTGTLQGGRVGIGGESTGWALEFRDAAGQHSIEVEL